MITRREFLAWMGAADTSLISLPGSSNGKENNHLPMYGPAAAPSLVLAHIADTGGSDPSYDRVDFKVYRDSDQLRTSFVSGVGIWSGHRAMSRPIWPTASYRFTCSTS